MTFTVTASGSRGIESEEFDSLDDAVRYFKLAYALGTGFVSLAYAPLFTETIPMPESETPSETFFLVPGRMGEEYVTSETRCSCPAFVYHRMNPCKHMESPGVRMGYLPSASQETFDADMLLRYGDK